MNACTRVVYFLYICHAFDVIYYYFIICVYSTLALLLVLYPAFGLLSASGLSIPNIRVAFNLRALLLHLVGNLEHIAFLLTLLECSYAMSDSCTLSWYHHEQ